ncbi:hypothetical protein P8452_59882 [Trifolium repens]|jgi:hypothetical protein|nr:hypothetical protein QL285_037013 [Trifolium repens]WJX76468.1 hypothetical protein P8452_59882 [Trifolium repens]
MLRDAGGEWVEDPSKHQAMVNKFYIDLFTISNEQWEWFQTPISFPILDTNIVEMLGRPIEKNEVKNTLFSMSPWKAPGPDGFPAGFFQQV